MTLYGITTWQPTLLLFDTARALLAAGASATVGREEYQLPAGFAVGPESLDSLSNYWNLRQEVCICDRFDSH